VRGRAFNVGDLVLCLVQSNKDCHKLSLPWEGPYVVVVVLQPGTYMLKTIVAKSSPTHGILSSYVTFNLSFPKLTTFM
jgi:hypothetical protein